MGKLMMKELKRAIKVKPTYHYSCQWDNWLIVLDKKVNERECLR